MPRNCPGCSVEMESQKMSGIDERGRKVVEVWRECPACGYIIDSAGTHIKPEEQDRDHNL